MVNLAHAKTDKTILDPFCGTGTTILEAALIGCKAIGTDVQRRMINGTRKNLIHFSVRSEALVVADARKLPLSRIDAVVTDPPYGKSATTLKSTTKMLVENIFSSAKPLLGKGQRICIALPIMVNQQGQVDHMSKDLAGFVEGLGFKTVESHKVYVHRTLTREVIVYEET
jgi:tRNA (guanine10-N2)-dimethyltransferase